MFSLYFGRTLFWVFSFVHRIVLFGALLRALLSFVQTSCYRSCFLVLSFAHKIVLFVVVPRAKNRAFWCSPSCQKPCSRSCFLVFPFVHKIVLFGALLRATNRAFWCFPSCQKSWLLGLCQYIYNYDISFHILPPQAPPWLAPKKHLQTTDVRPQSRSRRLFLKPLGAETLEGCPMEQTT